MVVLSRKINTGFFLCSLLTICLAIVVFFCFPHFFSPRRLQRQSYRPQEDKHQFLCSGAYEFIVSGSQGSENLISEGSLLPCDPPLSGSQTIRVIAPGHVRMRDARIFTDTRLTTALFIQNPDNPTMWHTTWVNDDTYDKTYTIILTGTTHGQEKEVPITFR